MESGYCDSNAPNPPCTGTTPADGEIMYARSRHHTGLNIALCDGSVRFVNNNIAIAIWQALGTSRGNDTVGDY